MQKGGLFFWLEKQNVLIPSKKRENSRTGPHTELQDGQEAAPNCPPPPSGAPSGTRVQSGAAGLCSLLSATDLRWQQCWGHPTAPHTHKVRGLHVTPLQLCAPLPPPMGCFWGCAAQPPPRRCFNHIILLLVFFLGGGGGCFFFFNKDWLEEEKRLFLGKKESFQFPPSSFRRCPKPALFSISVSSVLRCVHASGCIRQCS